MQKFILLFVFGVLCHEGLSFRIRRQAEDNNGDNLEDRYGPNRPGGNFYPGQFDGVPRPWSYPYPNGDVYYLPETQFPGEFPTFPGRPQNPGTIPPRREPTTAQPTTAAPSNVPITQTAAYRQCISSCLVTPEYNPVCGSDNQTYDNPGRLLCAQTCGHSITQTRSARCPAVPAPAS